MRKNIIRKMSTGIAMITICGMLVACTHTEPAPAPVVDATPAPTPIVQIQEEVVEENLNTGDKVEIDLGVADFHCEFDFLVYKFKLEENVEKLYDDDLVLFYQQLADAGYSADIECDNEYLAGYKEFLELRNKVDENNTMVEIADEVELEEPTVNQKVDKIPTVSAYIGVAYSEEDEATIREAVEAGKMNMDDIEKKYQEWSEDDFNTWLEGQIRNYEDIKANTDDRPFVSAEETKESIKKHHGIG